jgi:DNA-binding transcriptional MerR regulator
MLESLHIERMPMAYKRLQVAQHFGRDTETIRRWSIEFANYLSQDANSLGRNKSNYSDSDMETLTLIRDMYDKGSSVDEIHIALKSGQKGQFDGFLQNTRIQLSESQVAQLKEIAMERDALRERLQDAENTIAGLRARAELVPELQVKIDELNQQIGALKYQLSQNKKD